MLQATEPPPTAEQCEPKPPERAELAEPGPAEAAATTGPKTHQESPRATPSPQQPSDENSSPKAKGHCQSTESPGALWLSLFVALIYTIDASITILLSVSLNFGLP